MPLLHELDKRIQSDKSWISVYSALFSNTILISKIISLVHVTGKRSPFLDLITNHAFSLEPSSPNTSSSKTLHAQALLHWPPSIYFFSGRASGTFGSIALAFDPKCEVKNSGAVTYFDSGGFLLGYIKASLADESEEQIIEFVKNSTEQLIHWRDTFAKFLAAYFSQPIDYWKGKPNREDPEKLFSKNDPINWRTWTFEVKLFEPVNLDFIEVWCCTEQEMNKLNESLRNISRFDIKTRNAMQLIKNKSLTKIGAVDHCERIENWIIKKVGL